MLAFITRRFNTLLLATVALMAASIIAILATRAGAGSLDPPGAPASTGRNVIFQPASCAGFPIAISQPGSYVLDANITMPAGCTFKDGIEISASNVTLDLAGFTVTGLSTNSGGGVVAMASTTNLRVSNGIVTSWSGDEIDFTNASTSAIEGVTVSGSTSASGIGLGAASVVSQCVSSGNYTGVAVLGSNSTVKACDLSSNASTGVFVGAAASGVVVTGNHVSGSGTAFNVTGSNNIIDGNSATGGTWPPGLLLNISGNYNVAFSNSGDNNAHGVTVGGLFDDVGPTGFANNTASPWANITD